MSKRRVRNEDYKQQIRILILFQVNNEDACWKKTYDIESWRLLLGKNIQKYLFYLFFKFQAPILRKMNF